MIVDCHTHLWESVEQLGRGTGLWDTRARSSSVSTPSQAGRVEHQAATDPVDRTIVLAFKSHYLDAEVPNDYVADYVRQYPDRLIGFACVDPTRIQEAMDDLHKAHGELGMKGLSVWPAAQDFHPAATSAMRVYAEACRLNMPVMFHQDVLASSSSKMEFAQPSLIDEAAREFPELKIIIAGLGYPWCDETVVLLAKHRNVFADISGLMDHPWQGYNALLCAYQAGVMDALLFGSNFPYTTAASCIEALYSMNQFSLGTNLPVMPREQLRLIVERDALTLLGIDIGQTESPPELDTTVIQSED